MLTGEYPPQRGGVSDYTQLVARGLAAQGDAVEIYAPLATSAVEPTDAGVTVHRLPGRFGPGSLAALDRLLTERQRPDRILVQYVPHGFGWKAMNLPFALWVASRARRIAPVWVMFHEVVFPFSWRPLKYAILGSMTRVTARQIAGAADRVFVSIPAWGDVLRRIQPRVRSPQWLPVPCTLDFNPSLDAVLSSRKQFASSGTKLLGHFGTFGLLATDLLTATLLELLRLTSNAQILLVGRGSLEFALRFTTDHPETASRVQAVGELPASIASTYLKACDVLVQPYPDGVSSRRTSVMAGLANGIPVVTNLGVLSEPIWASGVIAAPAPNPLSIASLAVGLLDDSVARIKLGLDGLNLYKNQFQLECTISKLRKDR